MQNFSENLISMTKVKFGADLSTIEAIEITSNFANFANLIIKLMFIIDNIKYMWYDKENELNGGACDEKKVVGSGIGIFDGFFSFGQCVGRMETGWCE